MRGTWRQEGRWHASEQQLARSARRAGNRDDAGRVRRGKRSGGPGQSKPVWLQAGNKIKTGPHWAVGRFRFRTILSQLFKNCYNLVNPNLLLSWNPKKTILHSDIFEHYEQLFSLSPLPIPNRIQVTNFGTNSTLNSSSNFKGIQMFLKNSDKFLKILSWHNILEY
jgi:hypothetical protein